MSHSVKGGPAWQDDVRRGACRQIADVRFDHTKWETPEVSDEKCTPLLPCPFCGGPCDPEGWMSNDGRTGPACDECGGSTDTVERWNSRPLVAALVKALEFYANPSRYEGANMSPLPDDPFQPSDLVYRLDVTRDNGEIARAALTSVRGEQ